MRNQNHDSRIQYSDRVTSVSGNGQLNAEASGTGTGTKVLSWQIENGDNTMWYFDTVA